jgi:protein-S-isoprenylcysteine O-methyltransferase Ste14
VLAALVGATMVTGSRVVAFVTVVGALVAHAFIVTIEEPRLSERLGAAYDAYLRRVPRWVPRLGGGPVDP